MGKPNGNVGKPGAHALAPDAPWPFPGVAPGVMVPIGADPQNPAEVMIETS